MPHPRELNRMLRAAHDRRQARQRLPRKPPRTWLHDWIGVISASVTTILALVGAAFIYDEVQDRHESRVTRAWSVIHAAAGSDGNVGQIEALEALHNADANLRSVNLKGMHLAGVDLPGADLTGANFDGADLTGANLAGTRLFGASFDHADLTLVDFSGARVFRANFRDAKLFSVNFEGCECIWADFTGSDLTFANFRAAGLHGVNFSAAILYSADFTDAVADNVNVSAVKQSELKGIPGTFPAGFCTDGRPPEQVFVPDLPPDFPRALRLVNPSWHELDTCPPTFEEASRMWRELERRLDAE